MGKINEQKLSDIARYEGFRIEDKEAIRSLLVKAQKLKFRVETNQPVDISDIATITKSAVGLGLTEVSNMGGSVQHINGSRYKVTHAGEAIRHVFKKASRAYNIIEQPNGYFHKGTPEIKPKSS